MPHSLRAIEVVARGDWDDAVDSLILDHAHRRAAPAAHAASPPVLRGVQGTSIRLDLAEPLDLRNGDALRLEDGRLIEIIAAPESLSEFKAEPYQISALAWHLGNRHVPVQVVGAKLRARHDEALAAWAAGQGIRVTPIEAPFDPEGGRHAQAHAAHHHKAHRPDKHHHHGPGCAHHDHHHDHKHDHHHHDHHHHGADHHDHDHHEHGPHCNHDH